MDRRAAPRRVTADDDTVNFTREEIMKGRFDPQEMIDQMVAVIGADDGKYRHAWRRDEQGHR